MYTILLVTLHIKIYFTSKTYEELVKSDALLYIYKAAHIWMHQKHNFSNVIPSNTYSDSFLQNVIFSNT